MVDRRAAQHIKQDTRKKIYKKSLFLVMERLFLLAICIVQESERTLLHKAPIGLASCRCVNDVTSSFYCVTLTPLDTCTFVAQIFSYNLKINFMKQKDNQNIEKLIEMVKGVRTCMLITNEKDAKNISGRPMGINKIDDDGTMWFFTKASSYKVEEIEESKKVSIAITNESSQNYLMIHGTATLVNDKSKMKELWSAIMKAWFPLGLDDPDMTLIKVVPKEVDYWDSNSSKMVVLFNMLKAIAKGKEYEEGEHGKINL